MNDPVPPRVPSTPHARGQGHSMKGNPLHNFNLVVAFALELCALAALAYGGAHIGTNALTSTVLGVGLPLLAAVLWGMFAAPRAAYPIPLAGLLVKVLVFGSAAALLYGNDHRVLGGCLAAAVVANTILLRF